MAHFARIDDQNIVVQVIRIEDDSVHLIYDGIFGPPEKWLQTSYNTQGGQHPDGTPFRKNYASRGYSYDPVRDAFIPPQPDPDWVLNEDTCLWEPPQ